MTRDGAHAAADHAARESYSRLVALLAAASGDLALAEDALSTAFERALSTWPEHGTPEKPTAWLLSVARNHQRDVWKSAAYRKSVDFDDRADKIAEVSVTPIDELGPDAIGDKRLELLFTCAHPAIDPAIRTPLMLQAVLGFEAADVAAAFAVAPATMAQRPRTREATYPGRPHPVRRSRPRGHAGTSVRRSRGGLRVLRNRLGRSGRLRYRRRRLDGRGGAVSGGDARRPPR